jgi:hypothetical protein
LIMRVPLVEQQCQAAMGRVPVLKCPLSGERGHLRLCPVMPGN